MKTPRFLPVHFGSGLLALSGSTLLRALSMKILALGVFCLGWAALGSAPAQAGGVLGGWSDSGNAILSLAVMPDLTGDGHAEIAAGLNSGRVVCLSGAPVSPASLLWEAQLNGSASAVMALPFTGAGAGGWRCCRRHRPRPGGANPRNRRAKRPDGLDLQRLGGVRLSGHAAGPQ